MASLSSVDTQTLDRDRDAPALQDVDPVAFQRAGRARLPRLREIDRGAELASQRALPRGRLREHPRECGVVDRATECELRGRGRPFQRRVGIGVEVLHGQAAEMEMTRLPREVELGARAADEADRTVRGERRARSARTVHACPRRA